MWARVAVAALVLAVSVSYAWESCHRFNSQYGVENSWCPEFAIAVVPGAIRYSIYVTCLMDSFARCKPIASTKIYYRHKASLATNFNLAFFDLFIQKNCGHSRRIMLVWKQCENTTGRSAQSLPKSITKLAEVAQSFWLKRSKGARLDRQNSSWLTAHIFDDYLNVYCGSILLEYHRFINSRSQGNPRSTLIKSDLLRSTKGPGYVVHAGTSYAEPQYARQQYGKRPKRHIVLGFQVVVFSAFLALSLRLIGEALAILDKTAYAGAGVMFLVVGGVGVLGSYILALVGLFKLVMH